MKTQSITTIQPLKTIYCSRCSKEMERVPRLISDKVVDLSSLGVFRLRRFFCPGCYKSRLISTKRFLNK